MNDMRAVIVPKSDQINADDLLGGPMTITVSEVAIRAGTEQPVAIRFDGDGGKPWKPCKSMCRVMVSLWGPDASAYVGRSMTLYCDPKVLWGGMAVGGIRISHMSHIDKDATMALTATKGSKKAFTVRPLATEAAPKKQTVNEWLDTLQRELDAMQTENAVAEIAMRDDVKRALGALKNGALSKLNDVLRAAHDRFAPPEEDDDFPGTVTRDEAA